MGISRAVSRVWIINLVTRKICAELVQFSSSLKISTTEEPILKFTSDGLHSTLDAALGVRYMYKKKKIFECLCVFS